VTESTLSQTRTQLRQEIGYFLGYGRTVDDWSTEEESDIDAALNKGLRQFYFPPRLTPQESAHEWSFLKPIDTLTTIASYTTGTIAVADESKTVTLTTGTWPSWAATHGSLVIDTVEYAISTRDGDSQITLSSAFDGTTLTAGDYTLWHDGNYDMPDDFGGMEGEMTFAVTTQFMPLKRIGEGQVRAERQLTTARSRPIFVAVRPKESDGTDGQRFEAMLVPIPGSTTYTLTYRKRILANALSATIINPYGGMAHSDTILASCLAAAELQIEDAKGARWMEFKERLAASVDADRKANSQEYFGYNGDNSDGTSRHVLNQDVLVTYNGDSTS